MTGPTFNCAVQICPKKAMRQFTYTLEEIPIKFEIPLCGVHIGVVAADPATFIAALDLETQKLREKLQAEEAESAEMGNTGLIVPDSGNIVLP